jgi:hypothetical protein
MPKHYTKKELAEGFTRPRDPSAPRRPRTMGEIQPAVQAGPKAVLKAIGFPETEIPKPKNGESKPPGPQSKRRRSSRRA